MKFRKELIQHNIKTIIKFSKGNKGFYMGVACLGLSLSLLMFWLMPGYRKLEQSRTYLKRIQSEELALENFKNIKESYETRLNRLQARQEQLKLVIRNTQDLSELLTLVQQQALKLGVQVREIKQTEKLKALNQSYTLKLTLAGDYVALLELMKALEQQRLSITALRLSPDTRNNKVLLEGNIKLYVLVNSKTGEFSQNTR